MDKELLKELGIEDAEVIKGVLKAHNNVLDNKEKDFKEKLQNYVPLERFTKVNSEKKELETKLKESDTEGLQNKIQKLETSLMEKTSEIQEVKLSVAIDKYIATLENQPYDIKDLNLNYEGLTEDNLEEKLLPQINTKFEEKPYQFKPNEVEVTNKAIGDDVATNTGKGAKSNESISWGEEASKFKLRQYKEYK